MAGNLPYPMGHMIPIWAQKYWFLLEILGQEVGPISVGHTVVVHLVYFAGGSLAVPSLTDQTQRKLLYRNAVRISNPGGQALMLWA